MNYLDLIEAKKIYEKGENVTQYLRKKFNEDENTSEIIEIAYDLQAGSYIKDVNTNRRKSQLYASELADILSNHVSTGDSLLDVGTGELTTLALMLNEITISLSNVLAFDISWSRLIKGTQFFKENTGQRNFNLTTFVADMKQIPLHTKCVDIVTSSHALEPNGNNLSVLLQELFRIAKRKLVLFEPSYELNSTEGQQRMDKLGYIKGMQSAVENLGGKMLDVIPIENTGNPINPTACYVIEPPSSQAEHKIDRPTFCVPGTDYILEPDEAVFVSKDTGLVFPVLENIPILKNQYGILATAKF